MKTGLFHFCNAMVITTIVIAVNYATIFLGIYYNLGVIGHCLLLCIRKCEYWKTVLFSRVKGIAESCVSRVAPARVRDAARVRAN